MKKLTVWTLSCLLVIATSTVFASPPATTESPPRIDATIEAQLNAVEHPALAAIHYAVLVMADANSPPKISGAFAAADDTRYTVSVSGGGRSPTTIAAGIARISS